MWALHRDSTESAAMIEKCNLKMGRGGGHSEFAAFQDYNEIYLS